MRHEYRQGTIIHGNAFDWLYDEHNKVKPQVDSGPWPDLNLNFSLIICDPPYGNIVDEAWDVADYNRWLALCTRCANKNTTIVMWGGIGKMDDRPFVQFAADAETKFPYWHYTWGTWVKKRAYGKSNDYLFTREEALIFRHRQGEPIFNIPYLDIKRGYPGFNPNHPAKSEYLRRGLVWTDITEVMRDKIHPTQKPDELYRMLIQTHSEVGDTIFDPCAGSLTTARAATSARLSTSISH
jgi:DNA modification methylase